METPQIWIKDDMFASEILGYKNGLRYRVFVRPLGEPMTVAEGVITKTTKFAFFASCKDEHLVPGFNARGIEESLWTICDADWPEDSLQYSWATAQVPIYWSDMMRAGVKEMVEIYVDMDEDGEDPDGNEGELQDLTGDDCPLVKLNHWEHPVNLLCVAYTVHYNVYRNGDAKTLWLGFSEGKPDNTDISSMSGESMVRFPVVVRNFGATTAAVPVLRDGKTIGAALVTATLNPDGSIAKLEIVPPSAKKFVARDDDKRFDDESE